ncbi:glycosyltransferase family 2 protein, partial [Candidatus Hakubella thermalkaliphila]|uniref:glycosyltransferase family 2 protein n=1 Tax=Candidatus Hakubella thermalkaliphila TaxID=2754717 RepID=UPI001C612F89
MVTTVRSLLMVQYPKFELVVVNDGSEDRTLQNLIDNFGLRRLSRPVHIKINTADIRGIYYCPEDDRIIVVDKVNGGSRADAVNAGINASRYPLFCAIDADSILERSGLKRVVKPFLEEPELTIASGGVIRILNGCDIKSGFFEKARLSNKSLPRFQVVEYLRSFLFGRMGWSVINSLLIISGAFGLFRKSAVVEAGGFNKNSFAEDMEMVVQLHEVYRRKKQKYRIVFVPDPICWTLVPETFSALSRQRRRWHRGLMQVLFGHLKMFLNPRYGGIGLFAMPYYFFFEMLGPIVELAGYILVPIALFLGLISLESFLLFVAAAFLFSAILSVGGVLLDERSYRPYESWREVSILILYALIENFSFRIVTTFFRVMGIL